MTARAVRPRLIAVAGALRPLDLLYLAAIACAIFAGHGPQLLLAVPVALAAVARIWLRSSGFAAAAIHRLPARPAVGSPVTGAAVPVS